MPVSTGEHFVYQGKVFVNFRRDRTRHWIDVKLFGLPVDTDDRAVLELLLRHVCYRDSYAGTGDVDMETMHGPYVLNAISCDTFRRVGVVDVERLLRAWIVDLPPLSAVSKCELERDVCPLIRAATSCYQLVDLRPAAEHEWGWVVGALGGFHEFVLVDRVAGSVALMVMSDD